MVAIFTGAGTGFERGSGSVLGSAGLLGSASMGRGGDQVFLNAATGNLMISQNDEFLVGLGLDVAAARTYNSLGDLSDDNGDNWRLGSDLRVYGLTGTLNTAGSQVHRISADGSDIIYSWNASKSAYVETDGGGSFDTLTSNGTTWTWTDGDSRVSETYSGFGANNWVLSTRTDADGNNVSFDHVNGTSRISRVTTADGSYIQYDWSGNNLSDIVTGYTDLATSTAKTLTRTRYSYDASNRLSTVTVDLSPNDNSIADGKTYTTTYTYVGTTKLVNSISQSDGSRIDITYDQTTNPATSKVASIAETVYAGLTRTTSLSYGAGYTTITDPLGQVVRLDYDTSNQLTKITMPPASSGAAAQVTQFNYSNGDVVSVTDALGNTTTSTYDANGNALTTTDPLGNVTTRTYGAKNELLTETRWDWGNPSTVYSTSFESPDLGTGYQYNPVVSGISFGGIAGIAATGSGFGFVPTSDGHQVAFIQSIPSGSGSISQTLSGLTLGTQYAVKFKIAARPNYGGTPVTVSVNGTAIGTFMPGSTAFQDIVANFTATGATATLTFAGSASSVDLATGIDAISVQAGQPATTRYAYDSENHLRYSISAEGYVTEYRYSAAGQVINVLEYPEQFYNVSGLNSSATLTESQLNAWRDAIADKSSAKFQLNVYDARGNLTLNTAISADASGNGNWSDTERTDTSYTYDQAGKLLSRTVAGRNTESFVYDGLGRLTSAVDVNGGTTTYVFNDANTTTTVTLASGLVQTSTYDKMGHLLAYNESTEPNYIANDLLLDGTDGWRPTNVTRVAGPNSSLPYVFQQTSASADGYADNAGSVGFRPAPPGTTFNLSYSIKPGTSGQQFQGAVMWYDSAGNYISASVFNDYPTDTSQFTTVQHQLTKPANAAFYYVGVTVVHSTAVGQFGGVKFTALTTATSSTPATELYSFDADGRMRWELDATGRKTWHLYDNAGRKVADVLNPGRMIEYKYDADNRVIATIDHAIGLTTSQLAALDDANTPADIASYRPASSSSDLRTWTVYDKEGRILQTIDGAGDTIVNSYDGRGQLTATTRYYNKIDAANLANFQANPPSVVTLPAADARDVVSRNFYDRDGRLIGTLDANGFLTKIFYDSAGQKIQQTSFANAATVTDANYTLANAPLSKLAASADASKDRTTRYVYNGEGELRYSIDSLGYLTQTDYDSAGQATAVTRYATPALFSFDLDSSTWSDAEALAYIASYPDLMNAFGANAEAGRQHFTSYGRSEGRTILFDPLRYIAGYPDLVTGYGFSAAGGAQHYIEHGRFEGRTVAPLDFTYDKMKSLIASGNLAAGGIRQTWSVYDGAGRVAYAIGGEGAVTQFSYNSSGQVIRQIQFATTRATSSLPTQATMDAWFAANSTASDRLSRFYYDGAGVLRYTVDAEGFVTRRTEDAEGRLLSVERFANAIATSDTTTIATLQSNVSSSGGIAAVTSYDYDKIGRLLKVIDPEGSMTEYDHGWGVGNLTTLKHVATGTSDESQTSYVYDNAGRLLEEHRAVGTPEESVTKYTYDGLGNVLTITDPDNHVTTNGYDHLGQLLTSTNALGGVTTNVYNAFGEVVQTTDPNGGVTFNYYDEVGRLTKSCDALKYVTETTYTAFGEAASVTRRYNAASNTPSATVLPVVTADPAHDAVTSFQYDRLGRLTQSTDAQGNYEQYTLNAFGNRTSVRNKLGGVTTNTYDRRGLLLSETLPMSSIRSDGTTQATSVTNKFSYDARGNRTQMIEAYGLSEQRITNYAYDKCDRLISKSGDAVQALTPDHWSLTPVTPTESYAYDKRGNLIQVTDPNGGKTFSYYDHLNRKIAELNALGNLTNWTYDPAGNLTYQTVYDGWVTLPSAPGGSPPPPVNASWYRQTGFGYDALNRRLATTQVAVLVGTYSSANNGVSTATQNVTSWLAYDANGNVVTSTDANGNISYSWYDKLGRKTAQLDGEGYLTSWSYDGEGNVLSERRYATKWTGAVSTSAPPAVAQDTTNDRVTNFTYDRNGHRLTETRTGVVAWSVSGSNGALTQASTNSTVTYTYNGLGQVTSKTEATGEATNYYYDSTGRLQFEGKAGFGDYNGAAASPVLEYDYDGLNNLSRTRQGQWTANGSDRITMYNYGTGGRLYQMRDASGNWRDYYYDAAGNRMRESWTRTKSDGSTTVEGHLYNRDLLGRVTSEWIATAGSGWVDGDHQNSVYNAYGEVYARGINGTQEYLYYNNRGLLEKSNTGDGVWRFYVYDKNGNQMLGIESEGNDYSSSTLSSVLASLGTYAGQNYFDGLNTTINLYDKRNQLVEVAQQHREVSYTGTRTNFYTTQNYNAFGEVASQTDARGYATSFTYNTMGRLIQKVLPQVSYTDEAGVVHTNVNPVENYYYDLSGRQVATRDANGNLTSRILLAATGYGGSDGSVVAEFHADGGAVWTGYDVFGDARWIQNELGQRENRTYDAMGRLITQVHRGGLLTDNYTYDLLGQRITHWNSFLGSGNKETTDYDLQGRVVIQKAFGGDTVTSAYSWDGTLTNSGMNASAWGGFVQTDTYANGKTMTVKSDMFGHDLSKTDLGGHVFSYSYDKAGRQITRSTSGETLTTTWLNTGLAAQQSFGGSDYANYSYDANGNKLGEVTVRGGVTVQNGVGTYDALNRLTSWSQAALANFGPASKTIEYDLNGNVRHESANYRDMDTQGAFSAYAGLPKDLWFKYDSMNRVVLNEGTWDADLGQVVRGDGSSITYDAAGQRATVINGVGRAGQITNPTYDPNDEVYDDPYINIFYLAEQKETYTYNADGTLANIKQVEGGYTDNQDGTYTVNAAPSGTGPTRASFTYDAMGRLTRQYDYLYGGQGFGTTGYDRSITYNAKGQITNETVVTLKANTNLNDTYYATYDTVTDYITNSYGTGSAYALGQIVQVDDHAYKNGSDSGAPDTQTVNSYAWYDGAVQSSTTYRPDMSSGTTYTTTYYLSPSGILNSVYIADGRPRTVTFTNDMNGQVIRRDESDNNGSAGDPHEVWYRFNGVQMGDVGNNGTLETRYEQSIRERSQKRTTTTGAFRWGETTGQLQHDFDGNYDPINTYRQGSPIGRYTVQGGETLQGIAQSLWGDSSLWYKIAEANGLSADAPLIEGQTLTLPAGVTRVHNNASTFKPYDPAETLGNVSPTTPKPPKKNKCGAFGQILLVAIAVAVSVVTSGAALAALAPASAGITSVGAGIGAMLGASTAGAVGVGAFAAAGAIGGGLGSIASQGFGIATGIQDKFSWKGVALAAIQGGIGGAANGIANAAQFAKGPLTGFQKFITSGGILQTAARGAGASALTQSIGVVTGLQDKFDWAGVAAAGVSAVAGAKIGAPAGVGKFGARFISSMAGDISNAATRSLLEGSDFGDNLMAALPDIIGQTIGGLIADGVAGAKQKSFANSEAAKQKIIDNSVPADVQKAVKLSGGTFEVDANGAVRVVGYDAGALQQAVAGSSTLHMGTDGSISGSTGGWNYLPTARGDNTWLQDTSYDAGLNFYFHEGMGTVQSDWVGWDGDAGVVRFISQSGGPTYVYNGGSQYYAGLNLTISAGPSNAQFVLPPAHSGFELASNDTLRNLYFSSPAPIAYAGKTPTTLQSVIGKVAVAPYTIAGAVVGFVNSGLGGYRGNHSAIRFGDNSIQFIGGAFGQDPHTGNLTWGGRGAITFGNVQIYAGDVTPDTLDSGYINSHVLVRTGDHEEGHTYQYERLGLLFPAFYFGSGGLQSSANPYERAADYGARGGNPIPDRLRSWPR